MLMLLLFLGRVQLIIDGHQATFVWLGADIRRDEQVLCFDDVVVVAVRFVASMCSMCLRIDDCDD